MSQHTVAVIQARMGSSRLPGKVLLPLDCEHVLTHVVRRVQEATTIDIVVIATSVKKADDIIEQFGVDYNVPVHRGSETNVQQRMFDAAMEYNAETVVRITADCPLIDPDVIDTVVSRLHNGTPDYVSNTIKRTFPRGLDTEAFSYRSFERVVSEAKTPDEREHVTKYYHMNDSDFELINVSSDAIFENQRYINRSDLRLTLDEEADYRLLKKVYSGIEYEEVIPTKTAIDYIESKDLTHINQGVQQKT